MSFVFYAVVAAVTVFATVAIVMLRQLTNNGASVPVTMEWMENLSVDRYRPMLRLLEQGDLSFLRSQPGFRHSMTGRLRRQRCAIFQGYLRNLATDFRCTCSALRMIMLHSACDRPDLARILLRAQAAFACGLVSVQFHLILYRMGWASVDVRGLVKLFDGMQLELRTLVPSAMPVVG